MSSRSGVEVNGLGKQWAVYPSAALKIRYQTVNPSAALRIRDGAGSEPFGCAQGTRRS